MGTNTKNATAEVKNYGTGSYVDLCLTLIGAGAGKAPTVALVSATNNNTAYAASAAPPCQAEVVNASVVYGSTGVNTITLTDSYFAVAGCHAAVDDVSNTPLIATLGQWANLQTGTPATFVLSTYSALTPTAADVALNTLIRVWIRFKKDYTGASA